MPDMQVIAADAARSRRDRLVILRSAATGVLLILAGVLIGWLCLGTPLVQLVHPGRPPDDVPDGARRHGLGVRDPRPGRRS